MPPASVVRWAGGPHGRPFAADLVAASNRIISCSGAAWLHGYRQAGEDRQEQNDEAAVIGQENGPQRGWRNDQARAARGCLLYVNWLPGGLRAGLSLGQQRRGY